MGAIISMVRMKPSIPEMVELTDGDVENINKTWEIPRKIPLDAGEAILYKFLEVFPQYQDKFPHFKNSPLITLKGAPGFRTHAGRIVAVFDETIQALGRDDFEKQLKSIWDILGRNHFRRTIPKKAFLDLKVVMLEVLNEVCNLTPEELKSWNTFINNAYHILFHSMSKVAHESWTN